MILKSKTISLLTAALAIAGHAAALTFDGIFFPQGNASFADKVESFDPLFGGGPGPTDGNFTDPSKALGAPDYSSPIGSVSLGDGGRIILKFVDNFLTGSGVTGLADGVADLHIFEVGPDVEDTFVDISKDGISWLAVGFVTGGTKSIDIDAYGATSSDFYSYVRLTDDTSEGGQSGSTVGADIDAVGAITAVKREVPDAGSSALVFAVAFAGILALRRRTGR